MSRTATATATWAFDWELTGVPPGMPSTMQVNMVFCPDLSIVEDTFPLWKTAHAQDGACSLVAPGVAEALEALACQALHSTQVRRAMVDFVNQHGAHTVEHTGSMTLDMDLSDMTRIGLPCQAVLKLDM
tara:strand:+ start:777 stop:1163 length:387 start_codon:yes stop_codon:yes gene_type:complete